MKYYKNVINAILGKYIILTFILIGIIFAVIGLFAFDETSKLGIIFTNLGSVIIGGGFFSALTKTKHYTDFFQKRIFDVFFNPAIHISNDILKEKWIILTKSLLNKTSKEFHDKAPDEIYDRYIDIKTDYHYSDMVVTYNIELKDNIIIANQFITHNVIVNPKVNNVIMEHSITGNVDKNDTVDLTEVRIDNKIYKPEIMTDVNTGAKKIIIKKETINQKQYKLERYFKYSQNIKKDPFLLTEYSRFINGLEVRYKAINCDVHILPMGKKGFACSNIQSSIDAQGYTRVEVCSSNELTLPWQGFTLVILPKCDV